MKQEKLNISYYQQDIAWEAPEANYAKVEKAFEGIDSDILVVPETFSTGFSDNMARMAVGEESDTLDFARRMAKQHDALFVATWTVKVGDTVFNRMHLVRPDGTYDYYDKAHTFRMSSEAFQLGRGNRRVVTEFRGWRIKPAVCYDLRFPKWLRNERVGEDLLDYDILILSANWPGSRHEAWSTLIRARAIENLAYVIGVNRVGTDGVGIPYTGNSAAIDFKGNAISECQSGIEQVATATFDAQALGKFRRHWPFYLDFD